MKQSFYIDPNHMNWVWLDKEGVKHELPQIAKWEKEVEAIIDFSFI